MSDLAITRIQLWTNRKVNGLGKKVHRILPWQIVQYGQEGEMLEPIDTVTDLSTGTKDTDKEVTGFQFMENDHVLSGPNPPTGGWPSMPLAAP